MIRRLLAVVIVFILIPWALTALGTWATGVSG
jgi:hypothetical protein